MEMNESLGEAFPRMQARVREIRDQYVEVSRMPNANCSFAIADIDQVLREAEQAAMSGDTVRMIRAYNAMKDVE